MADDGLASLEGRVGATERGIVELRVQVKGLKEDRDALRSAVATLDGKMDGLRDEVIRSNATAQDKMDRGFSEVREAAGAAQRQAMASWPPEAARAVARAEAAASSNRTLALASIPVILALLGLVATHLWH